MKFWMTHNNLNVFDLEKNIAFYIEVFGMNEVKRYTPDHGEFIIVFLEDACSKHRLELTWLSQRKAPYDLGDNEIHLAFETDDFDQAYRHHKAMGVICFENTHMGIYFVEDPDGYWCEVMPNRRSKNDAKTVL